jgi:hypothetical protein
MHLLILSIALNILFISGYAQDMIQSTLLESVYEGIHIGDPSIDSFPQGILSIADALSKIPKELYKLSLIQKADIAKATQLIDTLINAAYWAISEEDMIMTDLYKALKNYRLFIEGCAIARFNQVNPEAIWTKYPAYIVFLMNFLLRQRNLEIDMLLWQEQFQLGELIEQEVPDQKQPKLIINPNTQIILETAVKYFAPTIPQELPTYQE